MQKNKTTTTTTQTHPNNKMQAEAANALMELGKKKPSTKKGTSYLKGVKRIKISAGELEEVVSISAPQKRGSNREFEEKVKNFEKQGKVTKHTRPILHVGHLRRKPGFDPKAEGEKFLHFLKENKILKGKHVDKFIDNKTKNAKLRLAEFQYESACFYNENALKLI